ncbi:MAG: GIY-YIG nuclease family protein [bacterium]|nr:GIY-YIG nuclease family protein [bacterium]
MFTVYILYSEKLQRRYIGSTDDIKRRFKEHNSGKVSFSSKGVPWKIIYLEMFTNKKDAQNEERFLKTGKGRDRMKYLLQNTLGRFA